MKLFNVLLFFAFVWMVVASSRDRDSSRSSGRGRPKRRNPGNYHGGGSSSHHGGGSSHHQGGGSTLSTLLLLKALSGTNNHNRPSYNNYVPSYNNHVPYYNNHVPSYNNHGDLFSFNPSNFGSYGGNGGCSAPRRPHNGYYTPSQTSWHNGNKAYFHCNSGYTRGHGGSIYATCNYYGQWSDYNVPTCTPQRVQCSRPSHSQFSSYSPIRPNYYSGDTCTFSCSAGYSIHGQSKCTCLPTGHWNNPRPTCQKPCSPPHLSIHLLIVTGRSHSNHYNPNHSITYGCGAGFNLIGNRHAKCNTHGVWSPSAPYCRRSYG